MHSEHDLQERQRRTNHSESFPLWGVTLSPCVSTGLYAPLRHRRRPLREYRKAPPEAQPGGAINPHARKGVSTFGNTAHLTSAV